MRPSVASAEPLGDGERRYSAVSLRPALVISAVEDSKASDVSDWVSACYRLTPRVERLSAHSAMLDLGVCTAQEAQLTLQELLNRLGQHGMEIRAGIGPTPVVAQLASRMISRADAQRLPIISMSDAPSFLKQISMERLLILAAPDAITVETLARLRRCGVRTLGQLARLDELTLRRQFGEVGAHLAALAQGRSFHPFRPTAPAHALRFCLRSADPFTADEALRQLPRLAMGMAEVLHAQGYEAGSITILIQWASGGRTRLDRALRQRIHTSRLLTQELARLVAPALSQSREGQIEQIRCTLSDLRRPQPSQPLLLPQGRAALRDRRQQLHALAGALAQRQQRPVLLASRRIAEHAIFGEDGFDLVPLGDTLACASNGASCKQRTTARRQDQWQDAPLRLHWW